MKHDLDKHSTKVFLVQQEITESNCEIAKKMYKFGILLLFFILFETLAAIGVLQIRPIRELFLLDYLRTTLIIIIILCFMNGIMISTGYCCCRQRTVSFFDNYIFT